MDSKIEEAWGNMPWKTTKQDLIRILHRTEGMWWEPVLKNKLFHGDDAAVAALRNQQPLPWEWKRSLSLLFPDAALQFAPMKVPDLDPDESYAINYDCGTLEVWPLPDSDDEQGWEMVDQLQEVMKVREILATAERLSPDLHGGAKSFFETPLVWNIEVVQRI